VRAGPHRRMSARTSRSRGAALWQSTGRSGAIHSGWEQRQPGDHIKPTASNISAALTGIGASVVGSLLEPLADRHDTSGSIWLFILVLMIGLPGYFFVFGVKKDDMVAGWMLEPPLLRRIAMFLAGAIATAFVLSLAQPFL